MNRGLRGGEEGFCLGNPRHPTQLGDDLCHICGALVQDVYLGTYQVKQLLGSGRSGLAYLAMQWRQPAVVKIFPPEPTSRDLWEEARREANQVATLHLSSIPTVMSCTLWSPKTVPWSNAPQDAVTSDFGKKQYLFIAREYAPLTFSDLLAAGTTGGKSSLPLSIESLMRLLTQAAEALALVHSLGLAHGALVPGNLLLSAQLDRLLVADFGFARLHPPSPPYLAPELSAVSNAYWQGANLAPYWGSVTPASDQFAFALLCFQLFTRIGLHNALERVVPVIQRARHVNPWQRFRDIGAFINTLAASLAIDLSSLGVVNSGDQLQITTPQFPPTDTGKWAQRYKLPTSLEAPMYGFLPPPPAQQGQGPVQDADQMEQSAGKAFVDRDYPAAEKSYLQALSLDSTRASAWLGLGDTYFALERYSEALSAYGQALSLDPNNPEAWFNRATVLDVLGRPDQATLDYERAKQLRSEAARHPNDHH